jgi:hypothetical protein
MLSMLIKKSLQQIALDLLGEADEVLVVGVHVSDVEIDELDDLLLSELFSFAYVGRHDTLQLIAQRRVAARLNPIRSSHIPTIKTDKRRTFSAHARTTFDNSLMTRSTHLIEGSLRRSICFLTINSNALSGVKRPTLQYTHLSVYRDFQPFSGTAYQ